MAVALTKQANTLPPQPQFLPMKGLCARWDVTRGGIYNNLARGTIPKPLRIGGVLRWRITDLEAWEAKQLQDEEV